MSRNGCRYLMLGGLAVAAVLTASRQGLVRGDGQDGPVVKAAEGGGERAEHSTSLSHTAAEAAAHNASESDRHASARAAQRHEGHPVGSPHEHEEGHTVAATIPQPLRLEHEELHEELVKATQEAGPVGEAAKAVAKVLHPHFVKEEEYALPPLGLLAPLAEGRITPEMKNAVPMSDKLKADLPEMLQEHRHIVAALETLAETAGKGDKPEYVRFAEKLKLHAQTEEQVLYPAAILVGEYLKLKPAH